MAKVIPPNRRTRHMKARIGRPEDTAPGRILSPRQARAARRAAAVRRFAGR